MTYLSASDERRDAELASARAAALARGWDLHELLGGLVAVPHGTEVLACVTTDLMNMKIRNRLPLS